MPHSLGAFTVTMVDTIQILNECIRVLASPPSYPAVPCISVDIEGVKLSRDGVVSIVQLKLATSPIIWLLDVTVLGEKAFNHSEDTTEMSIKQVLESGSIKKILYDVRNDADALYNIYGIDMRNVCDLQILELAVRHSNRRPTRLVNGLARSITDYLAPSPAWARIKDEGVKLFVPEKGGSYDIFEDRPLDPRIIAYCAQDVSLLEALEINLRNRMGRWGSNWDHRVSKASMERVAEAKSSYRQADGRVRALAPPI